MLGELRGWRYRDQIAVRDRFGRTIFVVDAWIYDVMMKRGDLARWFA